MVGAGQAEVGLSYSSSDVTIQLAQSDQPNTGSWVDQMPGQVDSQGKVNENLVEHTVRITPTVQSAVVAGGEVAHLLIICRCTLVFVNTIGPHKLRRLIFPFHSFW